MIRALLWLALLGPQATAGDLRMVERRYFDPADPQDSRYFRKGERQRFESRDMVGGRTKESFVFGPRSAVIYQCDLKRTIYLNLDTKRYFVMLENPLPDRTAVPTTSSPPPAPEPPPPKVHRSSVRHIVETKERKSFHGREAWLVRETEEGSATFGKEVHTHTSITETWYIDLDAPMGCFKFPRGNYSTAFLSAGDDPGERRVIGSARRGYPISTKVSFKTPSGPGGVHTSEVVEFSEQPLDPALFDIPADFTETQRWEDVAPPLRPRLRWWESVIMWFHQLIR